MRLWTWITALALIPGVGESIEIKTGRTEEPARIEVLSSDSERTQIRFEVGSFELSAIEISGTSYSSVQWEGGVEPLVAGDPALPRFRESIVIPDDGTMSVRVLESEYRDFPGVRIAPSKGTFTREIDPDSIPYPFSNVYASAGFFPANTAQLDEPYIMRDVRGVVVQVNPFRWNPATQTLRVYTNVVVEVGVAGPGGANVLVARPEKRVAEFERIYARHFLNYAASLRYSPVGEAGPMLVIAHDAFLSATQPLVDWKNQMGVPTTLVPMSSIGTTATQLKTYIQNSYTTLGTCFVILVGDGAQIPYFINDGGASDPMQTLLAGSDNYPDALIGRISAENVAQVQTQVERLIEYERNPDPAGIWYSRGVAIASNEGDGIGDDGEADWQHAQNYRAELLGFTYTLINELYDGDHPSSGGIGGGGGGTDQPGNPSASAVSAVLNAGRGFVHYTGHGSTFDWVTTGFGVGAINALTNDNMLPYVVSVGCVNGAFMSTTCFAEAWMRATHTGEPTGAISCYASTVNQQWATPMEAQDEMIHLLATGAKSTFGGTCFNGSCSMIDHYGSLGITEFKNWTLFGDPSLLLRTAQPTALAVTHGGVIDATAGAFQVESVPGALVAVSAGGELLGSAYADGAGVAIISFAPEAFEGLTSATLTVTAFNRIPSIETLEVTSGATAVAENLSASGLSQNQPNPFARSTGISLFLKNEGTASLRIYDVAGREIRTLHDGSLPAGRHVFDWDGSTLSGAKASAGAYYYRLETSEGTITRRMVYIR